MHRSAGFHLARVSSPIALAAAICSCGQGPDGVEEPARRSDPIYHGAPTPVDSYDAVGFLANPSGNFFCTATFIKRRCALTAAHCASPLLMGLGQDVTSPTNHADLVWRTATPTIYTLGNPAYDIQLLWIAKTSGANSIDHDHDYTPIPYSSAQLAIGTTTTIVGYGANSESLPSGAGKKRRGQMLVDRYTFGDSDQQLVYELVPDPTFFFAPDTRPLGGDSGGPLIVGGQTFGVTSGYDTSTKEAVYAGLYNTPNSGWLDGKLDSFCVPLFKMVVAFGSSPKPGTVVGVSGGSKVIDCGPSTTTCSATDLRDAITLTAQNTVADRVFSNWSGSGCACPDPRSPTCTVTFTEGYAGEVQPLMCVANYGYAPRRP